MILMYREIWTIADLDLKWLKESTKDKLFDADEHRRQVESKRKLEK